MNSFRPFPPTLERRSSVMLDSVTQLVPSGHEKPLRQAFYTAAAVLFTVAACTAAVYVYYILEIFIKPLMWALLCGSFLFPFKYSLQSSLESWLKEHEESGRPLIVGAVLVPISLFDSAAEAIGKFVMDKWKVIVALAVVISLVYFLYLIQLLHIFQLALLGIWHVVLFIWNSTSASVEFFARYRIVLVTIVGAYAIAVLAFDRESSRWLGYAAVPAWICLLICIVSIAGSLQVPLGIGLVILMIAGSMTSLKQTFKPENVRRAILEGRKSITALLDSGSTENVETSPDDVDSGASSSTNDKENEQNVLEEKETENRAQGVTDLGNDTETTKKGLKEHRVSKSPPSQTAVYFNFLFFALILTIAWVHTWVWVLLVLPFLYWCMKELLSLKLVRNFVDSCAQQWFGYDLHSAKENLFVYCDARKRLLFPPTVRGVVDIILKGDRRFNSVVLETLPTVTSVIMILILIIGSVSISLFFAVKIQQESFLLVQMTSDLVNETVSKHPEYKSWLPDNETMQSSMDSIVDKVYLQGREWITDQVRTNLGSEANVTLIEKQALKIWDRAYHAWFNKSSAKRKTELFRRQSTENILSSSEASIGLYSGLMDLLNMSEVINLLKENMSALKSVLESVWSIFQTNMSLIFSSVTTVLTILLSGGTAVLNFVLSTVVFFTALFYLLAGSEQQYMPVQLIGFGSKTPTKPSPIATSIQDAISGVFGASLKMASFYGLYTWLNHTALGAGLVYIPSLLAAIFSVVPIFTTYWACVPAFLELWLLRDDILRGVILLIFQCLPTFFVDGAIHKEMAASGGGHPYVTGLAVVGGLYYFGLEGVIIGPIVLCILLFAVNLYYRIINMPTTDIEHTPPAQHNLRISTSDTVTE